MFLIQDIDKNNHSSITYLTMVRFRICSTFLHNLVNGCSFTRSRYA